MGFPTDPFVDFISNAPLATTPGSSDMLALIQNGLTKRLPITGIPGLTPVITAPTVIINQNTYNALNTDYVIMVNRSPAAPTTINLLSSPGLGRIIQIKDIAGNVSGTNLITIANATIDGVSGFIMPYPFDSIWLEATGSGNNWAFMGRLIG